MIFQPGAGQKVWNKQKAGLQVLALTRTHWSSGWPSWLQRVVPGGRANVGSLIVNVFPTKLRTAAIHNAGVELVSRSASPAFPNWNAYTDGLPLGSRYTMAISYNCTNRTTFDNTHSAVMKSVRLYIPVSKR